MQDSHQIDHRVHAGRSVRERRLIVHIAYQHRQPRQMHHRFRMLGFACGHRYPVTGTHQLFAHMGTDKSRST